MEGQFLKASSVKVFVFLISDVDDKVMNEQLKITFRR